MPKILLVVITYNNEDTIVSCLQSIANLTHTAYELHLIDNASTDNTRDVIHRFLNEHPILKKKTVIIMNDRNIGFAKSVNIGLRYAVKTKKFFAVQLFNPDISVDKNVLTEGIQLLLKDQTIGACCPKILYPDSSVWWVGTRLYTNRELIFSTRFGLAEHTRKGLPYTDQRSEVKDVDALTGCAMLIRGTTIQSVGLFNEKYYMYMEDIDYSLRIVRHGWRVVFFSQGRVIHHTEDKKVYVSADAKKQLRKYRIYLTSAFLFLLDYKPLISIFWVLKTPYSLLHTYTKRRE